MSKWFVRVVTVLAVISGSVVTLAQTESIDVGDTVEGTATGTVVEYEIALEAGQPVVITAESNDFDTFLELYNAEDTLLESNDDSDGTNSRIIFTPESDGTYMIRLRAFEGDSPEGSYTLRVEASNIQVRMEGGTLSYGDTVTVETDGVITIVYTFEGTADDVVTIRAISSIGEDSRLLLLGPGGEQVAADDDSGTELNPAIMRFQLPETGTYTFEVQGFSDEPLMESLEVSLEETELLLLNEGPQTIQLDIDQQLDRVTLNTEAGETYLINISAEEIVETTMFVTIHEVDETARDVSMNFSGTRIMSFTYEPDRADRVAITLEIFAFADESVEATIEVDTLELP